MTGVVPLGQVFGQGDKKATTDEGKKNLSSPFNVDIQGV